MSERAQLSNDWVEVVNALDVLCGVLHGACSMALRLGAAPGISIQYRFSDIGGDGLIIVTFPWCGEEPKDGTGYLAPLDALTNALIDGGVLGAVEFERREPKTYVRLVGPDE